MGIRAADLMNYIICSHSIYKIREGWFRKRRQYFEKWYYRSLWEKSFVWTCV